MSNPVLLFHLMSSQIGSGLLGLARGLGYEVVESRTIRDLVTLLTRGGFSLALLVSERNAQDLILASAGAINPLMSLAEAERQHIFKVLKATNGNKSQAAKILKVDIKTLYNKLEKYKREGLGHGGCAQG